MIWILPVALLLIVAYKVVFPERQKSFVSAAFLLSMAMVMQFQNCGNSGGDGVSDRSNNEETQVCDPEVDAECDQVPEACLENPDLPECQSFAFHCTPTGAPMYPPGEDGFIPPCDSRAGYCGTLETAELPENCP